MLRVHFSAGDLARTRVAEGPDVLWEIVLSVQGLQERRPEPLLDAWRRRAETRDASELRVLIPLMPVRGYFPDFLTPAAALGGLECGVDAVRSTPRRRLRSELELLADSGPVPSWFRTLADGDRETLRQVGGALRRYHASVLQPEWPAISGRLEADRRHRGRVQSASGTEEMLRGFAPLLRWQSPVLTADYPTDRDIHLDGRGLLLVPSYFCHRTPVALVNEDLPPVLVYPARTAARREPTLGACPLASLMGHTRTAVLQSLRKPRTTSELALHAGVSLSTASEHAAVLRRAGLVISTRDRHRVQHALSPLGSDLLHGSV
ncbi:ArsR family transcriptional regulator [Streptomyces sp. AJS327]|uniref:ArsR/SmtB family transcription factor n=1 Tax=Streptomyces sp. AJS327 TaxID=2545265 RepID=UPI0015DF795E|nr:ArsR family transcriptional regulator [Streptomyces sp. AJS327]MBA0050959.1 ArsR family transcriptional regulator [Streptomyces sp. AJS327]